MKYLISIIIFFSTLLSNGQQRWESLISNGNDYSIPSSCSTSDGGVLICAYHNLSCHVFKTDANGQILWSKVLIKNDGLTICSIKQSNEGLISLAGFSNNMATIIMLDACGEPLWCRSYTDPTHYQETDFHDMVFLENGNVLAVNWGYTFNEFYDTGLVLFNESGDVLKVEPFDLKSKYIYLHESTSIELKNFGGFYIISGWCFYSIPQNPGIAALTPMFIKANDNLKEEWLLPFGLNDDIVGYGEGVVNQENGIIYGYGNCVNYENNQNNSILMNFDTAGNELNYHWVLNTEFDSSFVSNRAFNMLEENDSVYICSGRLGDEPWETPYGLWLMDTLGNVSDYIQIPNINHEWKSLSKMRNGNYSNTYLTNDRDILTIALNPDLSQAPIDTTTYNYDSLCDNLPIVSDTIYIDNCSIVTGIEDYEANTVNNNNTLALKAYPSPARNSVTIEYEEDGDFTLKCYNILGKQVYTGTMYGENTATININSWKNGMYVAVVSGRDGKRGIVKFVVQDGSK